MNELLICQMCKAPRQSHVPCFEALIIFGAPHYTIFWPPVPIKKTVLHPQQSQDPSNSVADSNTSQPEHAKEIMISILDCTERIEEAHIQRDYREENISKAP
jgi:hypothetical protein